MEKHHSNETKKKISISKKSSIPHNKYKISQGNITEVVIGNRNSAGGFIWKKINNNE